MKIALATIFRSLHLLITSKHTRATCMFYNHKVAKKVTTVNYISWCEQTINYSNGFDPTQTLREFAARLFYYFLFPKSIVLFGLTIFRSLHLLITSKHTRATCMFYNHKVAKKVTTVNYISWCEQTINYSNGFDPTQTLREFAARLFYYFLFPKSIVLFGLINSRRRIGLVSVNTYNEYSTRFWIVAISNWRFVSVGYHFAMSVFVNAS